MTGDVVALSPAGDNRPFAVIDSGWQTSIGIHAAAGGPWREPNRLFAPMAKLSEEIRSMGARPGIWVRPLVTVDRVPDSWALPPRAFELQRTGDDASGREWERTRKWTGEGGVEVA